MHLQQRHEPVLVDHGAFIELGCLDGTSHCLNLDFDCVYDIAGFILVVVVDYLQETLKLLVLVLKGNPEKALDIFALAAIVLRVVDGIE